MSELSRIWKPYSGRQQSGHQGEASLTAEPFRRARIMEAYRYVAACAARGTTWQEYATAYKLHHGQASAALSNLHRNGAIARLRERRAGSGIYVLNIHINERPTVPHRANRRTASPLDTLAAIQEETVTEEEHWEGCWRSHAGCALSKAIAIIGRKPKEKE